MTSPLTVSGVHRELPGQTTHTAQANSPGWSELSVWGRPERTARQERGSAPTRLASSGDPPGRGVMASSRSALLLRFRTTASVWGKVRSR